MPNAHPESQHRHAQVRRIVGLLLEVGRGEAPPGRVAELLRPTAAGEDGRPLPPQRPAKAPACGLWLERVEPHCAQKGHSC
mmetsp:Transcript_35105/g.109192  ORF Transcript_35105/g.109192 Transcript_35105/m.109192 type:complete len:81 (+) Transcript_35105:67-309(+)